MALTALYSYRSSSQTFLNKSNVLRRLALNAKDPGVLEAVPLASLSLGSVLIGRTLRDAIIGLGSAFRGHSIYIMPAEQVAFSEAEYLP